MRAQPPIAFQVPGCPALDFRLVSVLAQPGRASPAVSSPASHPRLTGAGNRRGLSSDVVPSHPPSSPPRPPPSAPSQTLGSRQLAEEPSLPLSLTLVCPKGTYTLSHLTPRGESKGGSERAIRDRRATVQNATRLPACRSPTSTLPRGPSPPAAPGQARERPQDAAVPLAGTDPEELRAGSQADVCTP